MSNNSAYSVATDLPQHTNKYLDSINFSNRDIAKIMSHLGPNKTRLWFTQYPHGKLWGNSICKPPSIVFNDFLNGDTFSHEWKKANVVPVHEKENKQSLKNYRPISLLAICSKIYEHLIYNKMFNLFYLEQFDFSKSIRI